MRLHTLPRECYAAVSWRSADACVRGCAGFNEWFPSAVKARKIVCFISVDYLKSPYCMVPPARCLPCAFSPS